MISTPLRASLLAASLALPLVACGGEGTFQARIYGEEFIEDGIPSDVFVDGWSVTYDKFLVVVGDLTVADGDATIPGWHVVNLATKTMGMGQAIGEVSVGAGTIERFGYRIAPNDGAAPTLATEADVELVRGHAIYIQGTATRGDEVITFAWGFDSDTLYSPCEIDAELAADGEASAQITIHADHIFYDDLDSSTPNVAFDLIAESDADGDGAVTREELAAVDITAEVRYQVGSHDIQDLWSFLAYQATTVGHINGEGHCENLH
ncbi:MAG: hypothetical protein R3B09_15385 [Nannocystaceae bacterium]